MAALDDGQFCGVTVKDDIGVLKFSEDTSIFKDHITGYTIEYDDEAILAFNPALREDLGKFPVAMYAQDDDPEENEWLFTNEETRNYQKCNNVNISTSDRCSSDTGLGDKDVLGSKIKIKNSLSCCGSRSDTYEAEDIQTNDQHILLASGDMAFGCQRGVERLARKIVARIQSCIPQLRHLKQELAKMQADVKILREEYSEIDNMCRKASFTQNSFVKTAKSYINNLDLVIYQNKVISHLDIAEKQMKLFECHVTTDKRIILVDPNILGTDVDKPNLHSASQAFNLIKKERLNYTNKADDNPDKL